MKRTMVVILTSLILASCASSPTTYSGSTTLGGDHTPHAGQWAVAAVGTPFYLAFKTTLCGATPAVAAPAAALASLAPDPYVMSVDELGDGVAANCGPPYVLSPS